MNGKRLKRQEKGAGARVRAILGHGILLLAVLTILLGRNQYFLVRGMSMVPTLQEGDELQYCHFQQPQYGDMVVFRSAYGLVVKRLIGLPGDVIRVDPDGSVTRNGRLLEEPYAEFDALCNSGMAEIVVGERSFFVLGDNRGTSVDSRDSRVGQIPASEVFGVVTHVAHTFD